MARYYNALLGLLSAGLGWIMVALGNPLIHSIMDLLGLCPGHGR